MKSTKRKNQHKTMTASVAAPASAAKSLSEERAELRAFTRYARLLIALSRGKPVDTREYLEARAAVFEHPTARAFLLKLYGGDAVSRQTNGDNNEPQSGNGAP